MNCVTRRVVARRRHEKPEKWKFSRKSPKWAVERKYFLSTKLGPFLVQQKKSVWKDLFTTPHNVENRDFQKFLARNRPKSTRITSKRPSITIRGAHAAKQSLVRVIKNSKIFCHKNAQRRIRFRFSCSSKPWFWRPKMTPATARSFRVQKIEGCGFSNTWH